MSVSLMDKFFGPLPREYCVYFYVLSIVFSIIFVISALSTIYFMVNHMQKVNSMFIFKSCLILLNAFFAYLANRLLHTMCVKSI
jgi:hypothetical protein